MRDATSPQVSEATRPLEPATLGIQHQSASQHPQLHSTSETDVMARPRPSHTQSAPVLSSNLARFSGNTPQPYSHPREYTAHLPHNPDRPPPHAYARAHEFPPFPPLAQHPVLPFLTTAFANAPEVQPASHSIPSKPRQTIAPRASTTQRHVSSTVSTIPTMDVSKNDPTAIFIRAPFLVPHSRNADPSIDPASLNGMSLDGEPIPGTPLTYAILHTHRNWFLDPDDFRKDNLNRTDYPQCLEPPRGWAPLSECTGPGAANRCKQAKEKKERNNSIRTKGSYTHGEPAHNMIIEYGPSDDSHESTILRCTFCRREYHGPNAKSMWRRHVFDKHKVAMKNRREGSAGMAPRSGQMKKVKSKAAGSLTDTPLALGPSVELDTPALTLDLSNQENIIRLLERVVSGNIDISLPTSVLNSTGNTTSGLNLKTIALALQKTGLSLSAGGLDLNTPSIGSESIPSIDASGTRDNQQQQGDGWMAADTEATPEIVENEPGSRPRVDLSSTIVDAASTTWPGESELPTSETDLSTSQSQSTAPTSLSSSLRSDTSTVPYSQKRKADHSSHVEPALVSRAQERAPLKDSTALDRNNHNLNVRVAPSTPRKDKGKQKVAPSTPEVPKLSQSIFEASPPSPRNPYTPLRHPSTTALRSRALATTGEESYLTLIVSSPAAESPVRGAGRLSFTSPFRKRISPTKRKDRGAPSTSDDTLDRLMSSPRYPFEFNIQGSSPYLSAFEPIPLETGSFGTPPSLGPPATLSADTSRDTSRSVSRADSAGNDVDVDDKDCTSEEDAIALELQYPDSPSSLEESTSRAKTREEDFDMDVYLDLEDAESTSGPTAEQNLVVSPQKDLARFSKEFGLLSPEEVERITAGARPSVEEARLSKRRRLEVMS